MSWASFVRPPTPQDPGLSRRELLHLAWRRRPPRTAPKHPDTQPPRSFFSILRMMATSSPVPEGEHLLSACIAPTAREIGLPHGIYEYGAARAAGLSQSPDPARPWTGARRLKHTAGPGSGRRQAPRVPPSTPRAAPIGEGPGRSAESGSRRTAFLTSRRGRFRSLWQSPRRSRALGRSRGIS